ncbi:ABC transporter permease [Devosia yakushimensis]|uniref:ABC transporter permease n=1 Tax=Devosia yakushimensis TaxID=470028 RepID=A0ABQ5UDF1_9HYPH|nr:ABC transporter permease [Devosia yakushimensis]GLQ08576.1 ABC transporter permease [Devosia yakushimensis]
MVGYIIRRLLYMIPMMAVISMVTFIIIQLPPGDFLTAMTARLASQSESIDPGVLAGLRERYGLDQPWVVQYWKWISGIVLRGDFGQSFDWNKPVSELIWGRLNLTMVVSVTTLIFVWAVAFPIGIYSAVRQYSVGDYFATFLGFLGLAIPNFLLALVLMFVSAQYFGQSVGGLFSPDYINAAWSWGKFADLMSHMWIPIIVLGTGSTAALIRIMRANLLDELNKPYVDMARARGLGEIRLLLKYPVRVALNPFISTVGWVLPHLVSGAVVVSIVLSLPTTGPLLLSALFAQDMYLAGSFILLMSMLTLIGTLISDLLLAWLDPRIRNG